MEEFADGTRIEYSYDEAGNSLTPVIRRPVTITIVVEPDGSGTTAGGGRFYQGTTQPLVAIPNDAFDFIGWFSAEGMLLSSEANYAFLITGPQTLTARFAHVAAPIITSPPSGVELTAGSQLNLSVTASGRGPLAYRWKLNGLELPDAGPDLTRPATTFLDAGTYVVEVSGPGGTTVSGPAVVTIPILSYEMWKSVIFTPSEIEGDNLSLTEPHSIIGYDGLSNLLHFSLGSKSRLWAEPNSFQFSMPTSNSNGRFDYNRLVGGGGITYIVAVSSDLKTWDRSQKFLEQQLPVEKNSDGLTERISLNFLPSGNAQLRRYCRLEVITDMVFIRGASFEMGNAMTQNEGFWTELPVHAVTLSPYYIDKFEVDHKKWAGVRNWSLTHGYSFSYEGAAKAADHPVHSITWYDAIKWCNARSEMEGLTPVYYLDGAFSIVYRSGEFGLRNSLVNWQASGYRLPTEAEWEMAARGGLSSQRFPWGNAVTHQQANYYSHANYAFLGDQSATRGYHPSYSQGDGPFTSPVGSFAPNGYGLYDMAGNVWEMCWDWGDGEGQSYYSVSPPHDPQGGSFGANRSMRGGAWTDFMPRVSGRFIALPWSISSNRGFRCVRR